jgi:excisionase family DNA binding protein
VSESTTAAAQSSPLPLDRPWLIHEVASYLRIDPRTVRRLVARGTLPVGQVPGTRKLLFDPAEVRNVVAARRS